MVEGEGRALRHGGMTLASKTKAGNLNSVTIHISPCEREASYPCLGDVGGEAADCVQLRREGDPCLPCGEPALPGLANGSDFFLVLGGRPAIPSRAGPQPGSQEGGMQCS